MGEPSEGEKQKYLTSDEIKVLYEWLMKQFITYEDEKLRRVIEKITDIAILS